MRFLCLHGRGTNNKVFELQTDLKPIFCLPLLTCVEAALRHKLGPEHEYEFVEGSVPSTPAPGINDLLYPGEQCYQYFEESAESLRSALQDLKDYTITEGPFDAVMGFSQGASIAATFIVKMSSEASTLIDSAFRCAIFICAGDAWDSHGGGTVLRADVVGEVIRIPTVHIIGFKDQMYESSVGLSRLCDGQCREVFDHGGGHEVPRAAKATTRMAQVIKTVIERHI